MVPRTPWRKLSELLPRKAVRLAFRKLIYRKVALRRYEVEAGRRRAPRIPVNFRVEFLESPDFDRLLGTNPYLTPQDVLHFRQQRSVCIAVFDGDRIAASSWMTSGRVYVSELQRYIDVPPEEHFSCRTYVDDDYRGQALMGHMLHAYSLRLPPTDIVWGLTYWWNTASIRSIEGLGWRHTGVYWTRFIFGRKLFGERHCAPRDPLGTDRAG